MLAYPGARQIAGHGRKLDWDNQWVYGIAHASVKTLTLVNMDCSTVPLALDEDGVFHYVAGREDIQSGRRIYKLVARGGSGEVLAERTFAMLMRLPWNGRAAGLEEPRLNEACR